MNPLGWSYVKILSSLSSEQIQLKFKSRGDVVLVNCYRVGTKWNQKGNIGFMLTNGHAIIFGLSLQVCLIFRKAYSQTCVKQPYKGSAKSGCLTEANINTNLTFRNILFGCLRQDVA